MSYIRTSKPSRRKMLWRAAAASGLGAIFKMTESPAAAQAQGTPAGRGQATPPAGAAPPRFGATRRWQHPGQKPRQLRGICAPEIRRGNPCRPDARDHGLPLADLADARRNSAGLH